MTRIKKLDLVPKNSYFTTYSSPVGDLLLVASDKALHLVLWQCEIEGDEVRSLLNRLKEDDSHPILSKTTHQLSEYFQGKRKEFTIKLSPLGTEFQQKAWEVLKTIPYAQTLSYSMQAKDLGGENYARAVGTANGKNPISIIVPCHRVISSSGDLGGFAGGLDAKQFLIDHEQKYLQKHL